MPFWPTGPAPRRRGGVTAGTRLLIPTRLTEGGKRAHVDGRARPRRQPRRRGDPRAPEEEVNHGLTPPQVAMLFKAVAMRHGPRSRRRPTTTATAAATTTATALFHPPLLLPTTRSSVANKKPPTPAVPPSSVVSASSPNVGASTSAPLAAVAVMSTSAGAGAGAGMGADSGNTDAHGAGLTIDDFNR